MIVAMKEKKNHSFFNMRPFRKFKSPECLDCQEIHVDLLLDGVRDSIFLVIFQALSIDYVVGRKQA